MMEHFSDAFDRFKATVDHINCMIGEMLRDHPEIVDPQYIPPEPPPDDDDKRAYYHGYLSGDRVLVYPLADDQPTNYGHVTQIRHGCVDECAALCSLVTVNIEGSIPTKSGVRIECNGAIRLRLVQVEHAD